jgi:hypothetical protein
MARTKRTRSQGLLEVSRFFMREGDVYETLRRLARRLDEEQLDYVVVGGMALVEHGYRRTTEDIDIVMRPETLEAFRQRCVGRGYLPAFSGAKRAFRDTESGVRIEVLTTGAFPGDGKPKSVSFPDPIQKAIAGEEFRYVPLETLIELKLASGLSAPHRLQDLADVQNLIQHAKLSRELAQRLDPSVRDEYVRLWEIVQTIPPPE